jgi:PASTA domain/Glucodextranase, domain B
LRTAAAAAAAAAALGAAACGADDPEPPAPPVRLGVQSPSDGAVVRDAEIEVRGRVRPFAAEVTVRGERAAVSGGEFSATVRLSEGANVIDVLASAPNRSPALTAVRVTRQVTVAVPDVGGDTPDEAVAALRAAGLVPTVRDGGGAFDDLFPGSPQVCEQTPPAGSEVTRGSTVTVVTAKIC